MEAKAFALPRRGWTDVEAAARRYFGVTAFRAGQRELIERVLSGRDAVGILPTGGGKSLSFQLPALFLDGPVVVVSPLLALMHDQADALARRGIPVERLDSTLRVREHADVLGRLRADALELLYVTPEGLRRKDVLDALKAEHVTLFVVDEAHCISAWGHDFRPAFRELGEAARALGRPPILALTATATSRVVEDIVRELALVDPTIVRASAERPALRLEVRATPADDDKDRALRELLDGRPGSTIIYTTTVKTTERVWSELQLAGYRAGRYHGDLHADVRAATQEAFMDDRYPILVATKAFGMGVDKHDVRTIVHYEFPDSLESYAQEAGRAGRDGAPARAVLLYRAADRRIHEFFAARTYGRAALDLERLTTGALVNTHRGRPVDLRALSAETKLPSRKIEALLNDLSDLGYADVVDAAGEKTVRFQSFEFAEAVLAVIGLRREAERGRLGAMMRYAESTTCRWGCLLDYFGEHRDAGCGRCDRCDAP